MGFFQDQDGVPKSEAIDKNAERDAEEGAPLLLNTVKRSNLKSSAPAMRHAGFGYNKVNKRPYRDGTFSIALVVFTTATVCVGSFAAFNYNSDFFALGFARYEKSVRSCTVPKRFHGAPSFSISQAMTWLSQIPKTALYVLLATLILSLLSASSLLWVLRKHTKKLFLAVPFMFIVLLTTLALVPLSCALQPGCKLSPNPLFYGILIIFIYSYLTVMCNDWNNVEISIRVIGTASEVLHKNLGLVLVLPALRMAFLLYYVPMIFAMLLAYANGKIVPELRPYLDGLIHPLWQGWYCGWEIDRWVPAYLTLAIFTTLWGLMILNEVEVFTVSGTISQWYFGAAPKSSTFEAVNRSLRHALGPSFGTLCFAGLVPEPARNFGRWAESSRKRGFIARFLHKTIRGWGLSVLPGLEFMTVFTTNFAAIMGEGFCRSASMLSGVLKRNFLSTSVANSVPHRLLGMFVLLLSASYGIVIWVGMDFFVHNGDVEAWQIAYGALVLLLLVLLNCARVLNQVIDSLYICYAIDKDNGEVSMPLVHDVYSLLPLSPNCNTPASLVDSKGTN